MGIFYDSNLYKNGVCLHICAWIMFSWMKWRSSWFKVWNIICGHDHEITVLWVCIYTDIGESYAPILTIMDVLLQNIWIFNDH